MPKGRPWMKFWTTDWLNDKRLRLVSRAARGLWIDLICLMHDESEPYGYLSIDGKPLDARDITLIIGGSLQETIDQLAELTDRNVIAVDRSGAMYSRRMVKDEEKRLQGQKHGTRGGHPAITTQYNEPGYVYLARGLGSELVKIGISKNPDNRKKKLKSPDGASPVSITHKFKVSDMGDAESVIHQRYHLYRKSGEWFKLPIEAIGEIEKSCESLKGISDSYSSSLDIWFSKTLVLRSKSAHVEDLQAGTFVMKPDMALFTNDVWFEAFREWAEFRRHELKKPIGPRAVKTQLEAMAKAGPEASVRAMKDSIQNSWQGVWPKNYLDKPGPKGIVPKSDDKRKERLKNVGQRSKRAD